MPEGTVEVELIRGHGLKDVETFGRSDPYAIICIGSEKHTSRIIHDGGKNPIWNQSFLIDIPDGPQELDIEIFDQERHGVDEKMGSVSINLSELFLLKKSPACKYEVQLPNGNHHGELEIALKFFPKVHNGSLEVHLMEGHGLMDADTFGKSDPYAIIYCQKESQKSKVIDGTTDPLWNQSFTFNVDSEITDIFVKLFDKDDLGADDPLGSFVVPLNKVFREGHVPPTRYKVTGPLGQPQGEVSLALKFTPWC